MAGGLTGPHEMWGPVAHGTQVETRAEQQPPHVLTFIETRPPPTRPDPCLLRQDSTTEGIVRADVLPVFVSC